MRVIWYWQLSFFASLEELCEIVKQKADMKGLRMDTGKTKKLTVKQQTDPIKKIHAKSA